MSLDQCFVDCCVSFFVWTKNRSSCLHHGLSSSTQDGAILSVEGEKLMRCTVRPYSSTFFPHSNEITTTSDGPENFESPINNYTTGCITRRPVPDENEFTTGALSLDQNSNPCNASHTYMLVTVMAHTSGETICFCRVFVRTEEWNLYVLISM